MKTEPFFIPLLSFFYLACPSWAGEVEEESQRLLGIQTVTLEAKTLPPEIPVYGSVLSPAPLIDLIRQIDVARAAGEVTKVSLERAEKLFSSGELVARKDVLALQAQQATDQAAIQALEDRLALEWGPWFSGKSAAERDALAENLLAGRQSLVRLSVPRGDTKETKPLAARLHAPGGGEETLRTSVIFPSTTVDASFRAQPYLGITESKTPLAFGLFLSGAMELEGEPREGLFVPREAVVLYLGKAWIYQKSGGKDFERVEVSTENPVDGGWFVEGKAIEPENTVIRGSQPLLSQESSGSAEE